MHVTKELCQPLLLTDSKSVRKILLETPTVINLTFKKFNFVAQCNYILFDNLIFFIL